MPQGSFFLERRPAKVTGVDVLELPARLPMKAEAPFLLS